MLSPKENDRDTLINRESIVNPVSMKRTTVFFPRPKSVHRGEEGYLGNQNYGVKAAEHEGGSYDTGCTPIFRLSSGSKPEYCLFVERSVDSVTRNNGIDATCEL